jgi:hypothetical protein
MLFILLPRKLWQAMAGYGRQVKISPNRSFAVKNLQFPFEIMMFTRPRCPFNCRPNCAKTAFGQNILPLILCPCRLKKFFVYRSYFL